MEDFKVEDIREILKQNYRFKNDSIKKIENILENLKELNQYNQVPKLLTIIENEIRVESEIKFINELKEYYCKKYRSEDSEKLLKHLSKRNDETITLYFEYYGYYYVFLKDKLKQLHKNENIKYRLNEIQDIYQVIPHKRERIFSICLTTEKKIIKNKSDYLENLSLFRFELANYLREEEYCDIIISDITQFGIDISDNLFFEAPIIYSIDKIRVKETDEIRAKLSGFKDYLLKNQNDYDATLIDERQFKRNNIHFQHIPTDIFTNNINNIEYYFNLQS